VFDETECTKAAMHSNIGPRFWVAHPQHQTTVASCTSWPSLTRYARLLLQVALVGRVLPGSRGFSDPEQWARIEQISRRVFVLKMLSGGPEAHLSSSPEKYSPLKGSVLFAQKL
jgi:hypothetical protein